MNILPINPADREAKSPCDKNIRYPVCVPGHDSPNGTTFLTIIVVYDEQKSALVDDPSDLINTSRLSPGRKPLDLRSRGWSLGSSTRAVFLFYRMRVQWFLQVLWIPLSLQITHYCLEVYMSKVLPTSWMLPAKTKKCLGTFSWYGIIIKRGWQISLRKQMHLKRHKKK
jgi:hypothetical protein